MRFGWVATIGILAALGGCKDHSIDIVGETDQDTDAPCEVAPFYADRDLDGHGDPNDAIEACSPPAGYVAGATDCDDAEVRVRPGAVEHCDGVDEDCDGLVDDDAVELSEWFTDADGDGYGAGSLGIACDAPADGVSAGGDCDDADASVFPGAVDPWDGVDSDCNGAPEPGDGVEVTALGALGYLYEDWQQSVDEPVAVRTFGIYRGATSPQVTVEVVTAQPTTLVLTSYEPVAWQVTGTWPGTVREVIHNSTAAVTAPSGVYVSFVEGHFEGLDDPSRFEVAALARDRGLEVSSAHTVHAATGFVIEPLATVPAHPEWPECDGYVPTTSPDDGPDTTGPQGACPVETAESAWCLATDRDGQLVVAGLDSGSICALGVGFDGHGESAVALSLAWIGGDVYGCAGTHDILQRVRLDGTEEADHAPRWCSGVVADGGEILVVPGMFERGDTSHFASWEDAQCGAASHQTDIGWSDMSYGAADGVGWAAWHAGSSVDRYDLASGDLLGAIELEGYDGWIYGVAPAGDQVVVSTGDTLRVHDATTGAFAGAHELTGGLYGLTCITN